MIHFGSVHTGYSLYWLQNHRKENERDIYPNLPQEMEAEDEWYHWLPRFEQFLSGLHATEAYLHWQTDDFDDIFHIRYVMRTDESPVDHNQHYWERIFFDIKNNKYTVSRIDTS